MLVFEVDTRRYEAIDFIVDIFESSYRPLCSVDKLNDWVMAFLIESGYQWDYCVPALLPSLHARGQCALGSGVPDVVPQRRLR